MVEAIAPEDYGRRHSDLLLWDYNFHYFDGLWAPDPSVREKEEWLRAWIENVPVGSRPAWEPYPTSRRILNWAKWVASGREVSDLFSSSLALQARYLGRRLEYHLMGNHLLANAVALTAAGAVFDGTEGNELLRRGSRILDEQLQEQFLLDGGHFEQSPIYHLIVVEDLLDLFQIARAKAVSLPERLLAKIETGCQWVETMLRSDGNVPLFNDAAYSVASDPKDVLALASTLGLCSPPRRVQEFRLLRDSGYFRLEKGRMLVIGDCSDIAASYQPGHTHCDLLSFELCWDGRPYIVDGGTSTYELGGRRHLERSTRSHNTVQFGDLEQSEIWASFRVGRRARVESLETRDDALTARVVAFPPRWVRHERTWSWKGETVTVRDRLLDRAGNEQPGTARLHFHPDLTPVAADGAWRIAALTLSLAGARSVELVPYRYAPEFNTLLPAYMLEVQFDGTLETVLGP